MKRTDKLFEVFEARFRCGFGASGGEVLQVGTEGLGGGFDGLWCRYEGLRKR